MLEIGKVKDKKAPVLRGEEVVAFSLNRRAMNAAGTAGVVVGGTAAAMGNS